MRRHLGDGFGWAEPRLREMGALMGGPVAAWAEETDRNPPRLEKYDRWGRDVSEVVMPPSFEAARREIVATSFTRPGFVAEARREGVDPAPMGVAWSYLLDQADIGMACALGTGGDMVVGLAELFAPEDVKARVRELFAAGEMSGEAAQMLTERSGGSDLGALESTASRDGDAWRLNGFKWFASNANGSAFVVLAKPEGAVDGCGESRPSSCSGSGGTGRATASGSGGSRASWARGRSRRRRSSSRTRRRSCWPRRRAPARAGTARASPA